jgi:hypothetical protein
MRHACEEGAERYRGTHVLGPAYEARALALLVGENLAAVHAVTNEGKLGAVADPSRGVPARRTERVLGPRLQLLRALAPARLWLHEDWCAIGLLVLFSDSGAGALRRSGVCILGGALALAFPARFGCGEIVLIVVATLPVSHHAVHLAQRRELRMGWRLAGASSTANQVALEAFECGLRLALLLCHS